MSQSAFEYDSHLTGMVQDYGNCRSDYVADCILPRMNVPTQKFKWTAFDKDEQYKLVNDFVGNCSQVHEINLNESKFIHGETEGHGLEKKISMVDMGNANGDSCEALNYDLLGKNAITLYDKIMLNRERRVAELVLDASKYDAADVYDLSGNEFNNGTEANRTDPLVYFLDRQANKIGRRPNGMLMSYKVWTVLRQSPSLLGNVDNRGVITEETFKAMFNLDYLCIADSKFDQAAAGLPANIADVWGKSIVMFRRNDSFSTTDCPDATFGFTAQTSFDITKPVSAMVPVNGQDPAMVMRYFDPAAGLHGSWRIRVGEYVKEVIADYSQALIIQNVIL